MHGGQRGDAGAGQPANKRVRRRGGQPTPPGNKIPANRAGQPAEYQGQAGYFFQLGNINDAGADCFGHFRAEHRAEEVHDRRHREGHAGRQCAGGYRGGDGICGVVKTVSEVKNEANDDDGAHQKEQLGQNQDSLRAMRSTTAASVSKASTVSSRVSTTSLTRSNSMASVAFSKSEARVER